MNTIILQYPERLWAVPIALAVVLLWRAMRRRPFAAFPLTSLLASEKYRASRLRHIPTIVAALALPLIALALTEPVLPYAEGQVTSRGLDIVLVLDLSLSMQELMGHPGVMPPSPDLVRRASQYTVDVDQFGTYTLKPKPGADVAPATADRTVNPSGRGGQQGPAPTPTPAPDKISRMDTTKQALIDFINMRPDDRIGLVVFSENAYLISPLTFDHDSLKTYVELVDSKIIPGEAMTAIGNGIQLAHNLLVRQSKGRLSGNQVIVVFTDGENNSGEDPVRMLDSADSEGIRVHLVAIDLQEVIRKRPAVQNLMAAVLQHGGRYFNVGTPGQLHAASTTIDSVEKGWLVQTQYSRHRPVYHYFAIPAILLLTGALLLRAVPYFIDLT